MFCTKCGAQLKETQKFCVKCGAKVPVKPATPAQAGQSHAPAVTPPGPAPTRPDVQTRPEPIRQPAPSPSSQQSTQTSDSAQPAEPPVLSQPPTEPAPPPRSAVPQSPAPEQPAPEQPSTVAGSASTASTPPPAVPTTQRPETRPPSGANAGSQPEKPLQSAIPCAAQPSVASQARSSAPATKKNMLWIWIAAAVVVLAAGGYFAFRHWHPASASKHTVISTNKGTKPPTAIPSGSTGSPNASSSGSSTPTPTGTSGVATTPNAIVVPNIQSVDFRNFSYPSNCRKEWNAFPKVVPVGQGHWSKPVSGSPTVSYLFSVEKVVYGDIGPGGQEAAVVHTSCGGPANFEYNEVFVFVATPSGPKLLAHLTPHIWGAGQEDNGGLFQVTRVQANQRQLAISFYAGGFHAGPKWIDTAMFTWRGNGLVRTGLTRRPFASAPTVGKPHPPEQPTTGQPPVTKQIQNKGTPNQRNCASWGFHPAGCAPTVVNSGPTGTTSAVVHPPGMKLPVAPTPNPAPPLPKPAPPPAPKPVVTSGTIVWSGHLDKNSTITIQGASASSGTLEGQLPGVPVMIQVSPSDVGVAEFPGPQNGWKEVVLRGSRSQDVVVRIQWKALQQ